MADEIPTKFGKYDVLELIERQGGARIYLARQTTVDRLVTLTMLPEQEADKAAFRARFERQIAVASRVSHVNVVRAVDAGTLDGIRYIASEHAGGRRLATALEEGEYFPTRACLAIALDIASALVHLEQVGIIHRGVTPRSVLLAASGVAKLRGFSLSKLLESGSSETWFDLDTYGACYASPEMAGITGQVDGRTDLYSFGCVVYHTLTGRPPFTGETTIEVIKKHLEEEVPDPRTLRANLPAGFATLLATCLAKDPAQRYANAAALLADLRTLKAGRLVTPPAKAPRPWTRRLFRRD